MAPVGQTNFDQALTPELRAPAWLRQLMREQTLKRAGHYARLSGLGEVRGDQQG